MSGRIKKEKKIIKGPKASQMPCRRGGTTSPTTLKPNSVEN